MRKRNALRLLEGFENKFDTLEKIRLVLQLLLTKILVHVKEIIQI